MDPNACLREMVALADKIANESNLPGELISEAWRLAELTLSLNDWLRSGGFLPDEWARAHSGKSVQFHDTKQ